MPSSKTAALPAGMKLTINPVIPHLADELWHYECVMSPRSPINAPSSPPSSPSSSSSSSSHAAPSRFVMTLHHSRSGNSYFSESRSPTKPGAAPPTRVRSNSLHGRGAASEASGLPHQSSIAASSSSSSPTTCFHSENIQYIHGLADRHVNHGERSDDEEMVQLLRRIFRTFDENSDGSISKEELSRMFERLGISSASQEEAMKGLLDSELFKERVEVDEAQFVALMLGNKGELEGPDYPSSSTQLDYGTAGQEEDQQQEQEQEDPAKEETGGHGTNMCDIMVGHDLEAAAHSNEEGSHEDVALMQAAFRVFDKDQNGFISPSELQSVLCGLGFSQAQDLDACVRMIQRVDQNGDGQIDFFEFTSMITSSAQPLPFILSF